MGVLATVLLACGPGGGAGGAGGGDASGGGVGGGGGTTADAGPVRGDDPFADAVVSFTPGPGAGFGQDRLPGVVLGPPDGAGDGMGSLDVLSLGQGGVIVLAFTDVLAVDGPGPDLTVFENPFGRFAETAAVAVSDDGTSWHEFPCASLDRDGGYPGCAGVQPVLATADSGTATDPLRSGGDLFDLAQLGVTRARFVRITDTGHNPTGSPTAGFDLDAVAVVHGQRLDGGAF
ncbi:MAG: cell surface protein [Myxococcaceae bacterium]|nr:cell surface protein [Myxococcaceae bacterium]